MKTIPFMRLSGLGPVQIYRFFLSQSVWGLR